MQNMCQPPLLMRKPRPVSRTGGSKVQQLETKLDGLVHLLQSATSGTRGLSGGTPLNAVAEDAVPQGHQQSMGSFSANGLGNSIYPMHLRNPALEPSPEDAEACLNRFRTDFIRHLPFLVIPPTITAWELRQSSPFLWLSVMTVASIRSAQQIALSKEVREVFGREAYIEGTRNLDLLLAVMTFATW